MVYSKKIPKKTCPKLIFLLQLSKHFFLSFETRNLFNGYVNSTFGNVYNNTRIINTYYAKPQIVFIYFRFHFLKQSIYYFFFFFTATSYNNSIY